MACFSKGIYAVLFRNASPLPMVNVYNGPKQEALFAPWTAYLQNLGVTLHVGHALAGLNVDGGRVSSARVSGPGGEYIVAGRLLRFRAADRPRAAGFHRGRTPSRPGTGPRRPVPDALVERGHATTSPQRHWRRPRLGRARRLALGDCERSAMPSSGAATTSPATSAMGARVSYLGTAISNFDEPGVLYGKAARDCSREEIVREVLGANEPALRR